MKILLSAKYRRIRGNVKFLFYYLSLYFREHTNAETADVDTSSVETANVETYNVETLNIGT